MQIALMGHLFTIMPHSTLTKVSVKFIKDNEKTVVNGSLRNDVVELVCVVQAGGAEFWVQTDIGEDILHN